MRTAALALVLLSADVFAQGKAPFVLGVEYTETGLAPVYATSGVTWAKTRLEAFGWGNVERSAPVGGKHTYDWSCTDSLVREYQQAGLVNLHSYTSPRSAWGSVDAATDPPRDIMPKPQLLADYGAWIEALVERYDGDGVDDMPGLLAPVKRWVVGGEWTGFWPTGNADDYLKLLEVSRAAILRADPTATVGLIPFMMFDVFEGNVPTSTQIASRLKDPPPSWRKSTAGMLKILSRPDLFDEVDVHSLGDATELPPLFSWLKARMAERGYDRPIFVDDAWPISFLANKPPLGVSWPAVYPVKPARYAEVYQLLLDIAGQKEPAYTVARKWMDALVAVGLVRKIVTAAGEGFAGIQIGNTEDWLVDDGKSLREFGISLLGASGVQGLVDTRHTAGYDFCDRRQVGALRPAFRNLAMVASLLPGFRRAERLTGLPAGVVAYRFTRPSGGPLAVAWLDSGLALPGDPVPSVDVDLPVSATSVNVLRAVTDTTAIVDPISLPARNGVVRLTLGAAPVFVTPGGVVTSTGRVPIVLSSAGAAGSFYTTELALTNRGTTDVTVRLLYTASFGGGGGEATDTLGAGVQRIVPDAIEYLRGLGVPIPAEGSCGGTLAVTFEGLSAADAGTVTARTTTAAGPGRAGLAYGAAAPLSVPVTLWGLRQDGVDRSNVAVVNAGDPDAGSITLRLTVTPADGSTNLDRALPDVTLPPGGWAQISEVLGAPLTSGAVRVTRVAGTAPFSAYAVVNDQASSDGSFVPPATDGASPPTLLLPVVVESGTFTSDVVLANGSGEARRVRLTFTSTEIPGSGEASTLVDLAPRAQLLIPSFVAWLRARASLPAAGPTFAGPVFVEPDSGGSLEGVYAGARTSTAGSGPRYGVFAAAQPPAVLATRAAWLHDLRQDAASRTNLAIVNAGRDEASFRVELVDGRSGALASVIEDVRVGARRWRQLDGILSSVEGLTQGYARVVLVSGSGPFLTYAAVNDGASPGQGTGDGSLVEMRVEE